MQVVNTVNELTKPDVMLHACVSNICPPAVLLPDYSTEDKISKDRFFFLISTETLKTAI